MRFIDSERTDIINKGRQWGYPECCIEAYLNGAIAKEQGVIHAIGVENHQWVPCEYHKEHPPEGTVYKTWKEWE